MQFLTALYFKAHFGLIGKMRIYLLFAAVHTGAFLFPAYFMKLAVGDAILFLTHIPLAHVNTYFHETQKIISVVFKGIDSKLTNCLKCLQRK